MKKAYEEPMFDLFYMASYLDAKVNYKKHTYVQKVYDDFRAYILFVARARSNGLTEKGYYACKDIVQTMFKDYSAFLKKDAFSERLLKKTLAENHKYNEEFCNRRFELLELAKAFDIKNGTGSSHKDNLLNTLRLLADEIMKSDTPDDIQKKKVDSFLKSLS